MAHNGLRIAFQRTHVAALALCAVFLPWSTAFLSMAQMLLAANWIASGFMLGDWRRRWRSVLSAPSLAFMSFFLLHIAGLLWTDDLGWGLDLCRILAPVLVLGVILSGSDRLSSAEFLVVLRLGAWSAILCGVFGLLFSGARAEDYRGLSMFISHIRLALLLCMAVAVLLWRLPKSTWQIAAHVLGTLIAIYLLARLGSIQGFVILALLCLMAAWKLTAKRPTTTRWMIRTLLLATALAPLAMVRTAWHARSFPVAAALEARSAGGEPYSHDTLSTQTENGTHVWTYVAWGELDRAWRMRSKHGLYSQDGLGHPLLSTVARYLSSKGLRKDSLGVMALTDEDVLAIEQGVPSAHHRQGSLSARVDEVLFELDQYRTTGQAGGHSAAMRIEFLRAGWAIARANWVIGVGTGDTPGAFAMHYDRTRSRLAPQWRLRAHNQYLTLWISFGILGLAWSLFTWCWPAWKLGAWRDPLFIAWAIAFGISCLTDDTIETQAGATFFALFYALLVFAAPRDELTAPGPASPSPP